MKILICTGIYPPEAGGPATYSKLLATELIKRGHEVAVITYSGKPINGQATGSPPIYRLIRIQRSWFKPLHYWKYFQAVKRHGKNFDLLYAQDPVSAGYPSYLAAKILKKPLVVKITGDYSWEQAMGRGKTSLMIDDFQNEKHFGAINLMRRIQVHVCKEANRVIVPSEYLNNLVMGWGVKEKKISMIYNAVHVPDVAASRGAGKFLVVSSGRQVSWKGFEVIKKAIAELGPDFELRILHSMPREEYLRTVKSADAFVLNTAYEGFAHTVLEVMTLGVPVITTPAGGNKELVKDGINGLLVPYNDKEQIKDAVKKIHDDAGLRDQLVGAAREDVKKFTVEAMIHQTEGVLRQCVS